MANPVELFGKANHNGGGGYRNHKIKVGANRYRIGPPYKSLAAEGRWFWYTRQHFGYSGMSTREAGKTVARPFLCPLEIDRRTEMVLVACKECEQIEAKQELVKQREAQYEAEGKSEEDIYKLLKLPKEWLKSHNVDKKYNVLAKNEKGEWGVLPIGYKAKEALDKRRKELLDEGIDPFDIENGVWFDFKREGEGRNTTYTCDIAMEVEVVNGKKVRSYKMDTMTEADFNDIVRNCPDLPDVGRKVTPEQVAQLVASDGDPEEVDRILETPKKARESSKEQSAAPKAKMPPKPEPKPEPVPEPKPEPKEPKVADSAPVEDDEEAALLAQLEKLKAKKAADQAAQKLKAAEAELAAKVEQDPKVEVRKPVDLKNMSDDEFTVMFQKKK